MDPILLSVVGIAVFLVLLFLGLHIGLSMAVVGFLGFALVRGFPAAFGPGLQHVQRSYCNPFISAWRIRQSAPADRQQHKTLS